MASLITRVDTLELFLVGSFEKQNVLAETMHYLKARIRTEMRFFSLRIYSQSLHESWTLLQCRLLQFKHLECW
jgi:hypothetical protein